MDHSPFSFFRGSAGLMAMDLAFTPTTRLRVQMCGDAHVQNLGAYAAPDGHLVFDLNDFDESVPGPWEWDLKRFATSLILAGGDAGDSRRESRAAMMSFLESYTRAMEEFARLKPIELAKWQVKRSIETKPVRQVLRKAERATPDVTLKKLTVRARDGAPRFHDRPPLLTHVPQSTAELVLASLSGYRANLPVDRGRLLDWYRPTDVASKVVGTGSVGTRNYVVLLSGSRADDFLFLQVKEEETSCYSRYLKPMPRFANQGRRVAEAQHRSQTWSDPLLGWTRMGNKDYLVRQLSDHKASIEPKELKGSNLAQYGIVCGEVLAKAHARTGDPAAIAGYCGRSGKLEKAIAKFAQAYAEQTERDYDDFHKAVKTGKLPSVATA
jgi:uncharacterized protein (DUF2252 family)